MAKEASNATAVTNSSILTQQPPPSDDVTSDADADFEFAVAAQDPVVSPPITADEIFANGRILPLYYPLFDRGPLRPATPPEPSPVSAVRGRLRHLLMAERDRRAGPPPPSSSSSSSEADELEGIPEDSYCVWVPKSARRRCEKSGSVGSSSSLRHRLRGLVVGRSSSDGRESLFFFEPDRKRPFAPPGTADSGAGERRKL